MLDLRRASAWPRTAKNVRGVRPRPWDLPAESCQPTAREAQTLPGRLCVPPDRLLSVGSVQHPEWLRHRPATRPRWRCRRQKHPPGNWARPTVAGGPRWRIRLTSEPEACQPSGPWMARRRDLKTARSRRSHRRTGRTGRPFHWQSCRRAGCRWDRQASTSRTAVRDG